jgi:hypothetical protein
MTLIIMTFSITKIYVILSISTLVKMTLNVTIQNCHSEYNDNQHNNTQHYNIIIKCDSLHNNTQHNNKNAILNIMTISITILIVTT